MGLFLYTARTRKGQRVEGTVEAPDRRAAQSQVERMGHVPISVVEKSAATAQTTAAKTRFTWRRVKKMGSREVLIFTTELSDLLASGMKLGNAS